MRRAERLVVLELRGSFLEKRLHPFLHVLRAGKQAEERRLEDLSLGERHLASAHHRFDRAADGQRTAGHDLARHLLGGGHELIGRNHFVHQADALRFHGTDADIDIATATPEFRAWQWVEPKRLPDLIVPFKRDLYRELLDAFADYI